MPSLKGELNPSYRHGHCTRTGHSGEYSSWSKMRRRCNEPSNNRYKDYGARGIKVCERWSSFEVFLSDMGPKPSPLHSLDRIDTNGNYDPSNCRWATSKQQNNNRRDNVVLDVNGKRQTMTQWANETGIKVGTIWYRIKAGWSPSEAILTPGRRRA